MVSDLIVKHLGKSRLVADLDPDDFAALRNKVAKRWGPHRLGSKLIQYTRCLFKHACDAGLIATPVRFGPGFKRPSKKTLRLTRAEQGPVVTTIALWTSGCGTIANMAGVPLQDGIQVQADRRVYGGVRADLRIGNVRDLPLSAVGDTVTLPIIVPCSLYRSTSSATESSGRAGSAPKFATASVAEN